MERFLYDRNRLAKLGAGWFLAAAEVCFAQTDTPLLAPPGAAPLVQPPVTEVVEGIWGGRGQGYSPGCFADRVEVVCSSFGPDAASFTVFAEDRRGRGTSVQNTALGRNGCVIVSFRLGFDHRWVPFLRRHQCFGDASLRLGILFTRKRQPAVENPDQK